MKVKATFTTENIRKKFLSTFDLVNYAIKLAENMVKSGRAARVQSEVENPAVQVIDEINQGRDHFDDIPGEFDEDEDDLGPINGKIAKEPEAAPAEAPAPKKGHKEALKR